MRRAALLAVLIALHACGGGETPPPTQQQPARASAAAPRRDPLVGGPYPAILVAQAQFVEGTGADGKPTSVPGPAKLIIVRKTESGWKPVVIEDPDSNVFHKALAVGRRRAHHRRHAGPAAHVALRGRRVDGRPRTGTRSSAASSIACATSSAATWTATARTSW